MTPSIGITFARPHRLARSLVRAALESSAIALVVAVVGINALVYGASLADLERGASVLAGMAADSSSAALLFNDARSAGETLEFLKGSPEVTGATIRDARGVEFARYRAAGLPPGDGGELRSTRDIVQDGRVIGRITLTVSTRLLARQSWILAGSTLSCAMLGLGIAFLRVRRVRRAVARNEDELDRLAFRDPVTGLFNRHAAQEHLVRSVAGAGSGFTVALLDLDDFKLVNDTLGHAAGDELLRSLGGRLQSTFEATGTVFRLGGDEFIVICPGEADERGVARLGRRLVDCLAEAFDVAGRQLFVRGSAGIAAFPEHGTDAEELLRATDTAMYQAKGAGKNTFAVYNAEMARAAEARLRLCEELARAIERDELVLHYQPIVDMADRSLIGVEALVRWRHPSRGLLGPGEFIPAAEASGLIVELGGWVLRAAAAQQADWASRGLGVLFVAVNVSAQQFRQKVLLDQVQTALAATGADAHRLQIELTEHTLVEDISLTAHVLASLRLRGMKVAIDDFGTGLSSLAYLRRLPIDKLKIDRSFVNDMTSGDEGAAIVEAIVSLAHSLRLEIVAEGIETVVQAQALQALGVQHGQGYLFSLPVAADEIESLWRVHRGAAASPVRQSA